MSLIYFHIFLMSVAVVFAGGFGLWEAQLFQRSHQTLDLVTAVSSVILGIGILIYLIWFIRKKKPAMH
ncbi:MAG: hypothetical protein COV74_07175 [Candidatus Omnitrophica bacterium CG11_big_fil_rev_8_21_14_0_20_45_26]|uniref:Uncharacterized protein n=1 Tax=Candidatus Abzuiibacterium crystallinum TaxID=1974748 RepID=A0A2H0LMY4_9BACT|nr:MAG: hypothetical protein COV74_07175 [Candidatus Omnitrophica bacterium CG11_big_fil_rev_8_21_14_0_20_45_26]PIW65484.1 MAG: hypothetical protein COW12_01435 [Candidatus Omnitrophica bacterium CG12_big_fil_rev_8_21_14_0_65_45_16]